MKNRLPLFVSAVLLGALCVVLPGSCDIDFGDNTSSFTVPPVLTLSSASGGVRYSFKPSVPAADSYDVYYMKSNTATMEDLQENGTRISNAPLVKLLADLESDAYYTVMVTANKSGFPAMNSGSKRKVAGKVSTTAKTKRGVGYGFEEGNPATPADDMRLLTTGSPATVKWFYNWGILNPTSAVSTSFSSYGLTYAPMLWNDNWQEATVRAYKTAHPSGEYLLAFNEPNLTDQANMTPAVAAGYWARVKAIAAELGLKIVSPAMNYGTLANYGDPIKWLDEFFAKPEVSINDIAAISIHCYMPNAAALKSYVERFKKYNKPIWMTEFCAWDGIGDNAATWEATQMDFMSDAVTYLELDDTVERYAWFIPKDRNSNIAEKPYNKLLTHAPVELTPLGKMYVNMSNCDKTQFAAKGAKIEAEHFTECNLADWVGVEGFSRSVRFRPSTDAAGVPNDLEINSFSNGIWVSYQVNLASDGTSITLRNKAVVATAMNIYIDGTLTETVSLPQGDWTDKTVPIAISAGKHTIRLEVSAGNCALNWLKVD